MKHNLEFIANFASLESDPEKRDKIKAVHFDNSGHVVATNSHILFASKEPYELSRANKTYTSKDIKKSNFIEASLSFPDWKFVIPVKCAKKITLQIPSWFSDINQIPENVTMILDYSNVLAPFIKIASKTDETSMAFNAKYLSSFSGQSITILILGTDQPTVFLPEKSTIDPHSKSLKQDILQEEWFFLLMPIKLEEEVNSSKVYL